MKDVAKAFKTSIYCFATFRKVRRKMKEMKIEFYLNISNKKYLPLIENILQKRSGEFLSERKQNLYKITIYSEFN